MIFFCCNFASPNITIFEYIAKNGMKRYPNVRM